MADRAAVSAEPAELPDRLAQHLISTGGVAVGVTALIVVLGVMNGLRDDLRERILVANPHLRILTFGSDCGWTIGERAQPRCASSRGRGRRPEVISQAGHHRRPGLWRGVNLRRLRARHRHVSVTSLPQSITKGDLSFRTTKPGVDGGVLLGSRLASRLSVYPGDMVDPGAGHPGQGQSGAGRGGAALLEIRGHRAVRYRHVPV